MKKYIVSIDTTPCMYDNAKDILFDKEIHKCMKLTLEELRMYVAREYPEYQVSKMNRYELMLAIVMEYCS